MLSVKLVAWRYITEGVGGYSNVLLAFFFIATDFNVDHDTTPINATPRSRSDASRSDNFRKFSVVVFFTQHDACVNLWHGLNPG